MAVAETQQLLQLRLREREPVDSSKVRGALINMEGEGGLSLHEPINIGVLSARLKRDINGIEVMLHDTQPELSDTGKVNTTKLAKKIKTFVDDPTKPGIPTVLGLSVPIYSWSYTEALLLKLDQDPPENPLTIVLGNAIPTYTPDLVKKKFPNVHIVVGEGEERFSSIVQQVGRGEPVQDSYRLGAWLRESNSDFREYAGVDRELTAAILERGGSVKVEDSRGCKYGACTFCSRTIRGGKDYGVIPEDKVIEQVRDVNGLLRQFNATRFEFTGEETFDDLEATRRLIQAFKNAQDEKSPDRLPVIPFVVSLRVGLFNQLHDEGLLEQLHEVGLRKVFLGVEGASDPYLRQIAKGQRLADINKAIHTIESHNADPQTKEDKKVEMEMGFITFSWRMDKKMLEENIKFMTQGKNAEYISSLFNLLEVRAGTIDQRLLNEYTSKQKEPPFGKERLEGYKPDEHFSINSSKYENVPFLDAEVGRIYKEAQAFSSADEKLYYALKSVSRADSLPKGHQNPYETVKKFYLGMKDIHLKFLQNAVGLAEIPDIPQTRLTLIQEMQEAFGTDPQQDGLDAVRREVQMFLSEEAERKQALGTKETLTEQRGALAVCIDDQGRHLLVRARFDEDWGYPGGNVKPDESPKESLAREGREELGIDLIVGKHLVTTVKEHHVDRTTGERPKLRLHHFLAGLTDEIDLSNADNEIADYIWIPTKDALGGKIKLKDNVKQVMEQTNAIAK